MKFSAFKFLNNRSSWSKNKYAWWTAISTFSIMVLIEVLFSIFNNYENLAVRMINLLVLLLLFINMVYDFSRLRKHATSYFTAFKLCIRTGIYFCLIFFPALFLLLSLDHKDLIILQMGTPFGQQYSAGEIMGALFIEVPVFIIIAALVSSPAVGFNQNSKFL
ncbi:hypothetical protein [Zunongwangia sp. H14]|uniref:hypothetical protein n=1 Tax=Zunongwangia sp. H14 TaxID=3240792 RepID=UPI003563B520